MEINYWNEKGFIVIHHKVDFFLQAIILKIVTAQSIHDIILQIFYTNIIENQLITIVFHYYFKTIPILKKFPQVSIY